MKKLIIKTFLALSLSLFVGMTAFAQGSPPPPPPGGGHGQSTNQDAGGGGAPIGSGVGILLALGAAYGGRKIYSILKQQEKLEE